MEDVNSPGMASHSVRADGVAAFTNLIPVRVDGRSSPASLFPGDAAFGEPSRVPPTAPSSGSDPWRGMNMVSLTVAGTVGMVTGLLFTLSEFFRFIPPMAGAQANVARAPGGDPFAVVSSPILDLLEHAVGPVAVTTTAALVTAFALGDHFRRAASARSQSGPRLRAWAPGSRGAIAERGAETQFQSADSATAEHPATDCARCEATYEAAILRAEAAALEKSRFIAMVSHELRTPLNAIIGFSQIIRDEAAESVARDGSGKSASGGGAVASHAEFAEEINASGRHLLNLINEMLELASVDGTVGEATTEEMDLAVTVDAARRAVAPQIMEAGLTLDVRVADDARRLRADPRALRRVIDHLLSNAIKFTPPGGVVTIGARRWGDRLELVVADTGEGISKDQIARVFDPFWQSGPVMSRSHGGTGLGLALVKATTEALGGTVRIESGRGAVAVKGGAWGMAGESLKGARPPTDGGDDESPRGTTVTVTLPLR